jgi:RHS repeat-associated protein
MEENPHGAASSVPQISLPKGGGAIQGIGEKFGANPATGTGSMTVPIALSPGRTGLAPQLSLSYDSGAGNGPFGLGWSLSLPAITRKTDKGLPQYGDTTESDVFILAGAEDLVPVPHADTRSLDGVDFRVQQYRPRIEGLFARIEKWSRATEAGDIRWRVISRDNVTTWYGKTAESRIADSAVPTRIFSWLICESFDDKGNAAIYRYKREDSAGIDVASLAHERNRTAAGRSVGRYLKRVQYANRTPYRPGEDLAQRNDWLLEAVFDYGEHYTEDADGSVASVFVSDENRAWAVRQDPFSAHRAGFEVRTYRLCQRVLMFHHFPQELGAVDCLVRSTDFLYRPGPLVSFVTQIVQCGYVRRPDGSYLKKTLPPLEFEYSEAVVNETVHELDPVSLENLPSGGYGARQQWVDLDGEGVPSVLVEQDEGWYYKRNVSPLETEAIARFDPLTEVATLPALAGAANPRHQFVDLAGDGQLDCVVLESPAPGFFERTDNESWDAFKPLQRLPNVDWRDSNLRFMDLTGDGRADIVITEDAVLTWYPSRGEGGFGRGIRVPLPRDEDVGPVVAFADSTQSVFVADMSGDGLADIVRVRNGEVCYWPNLGYGRFGAQVCMDAAPWFDAPDVFDPRRIRLADIDGSGATDIIYLAGDGVRLYFNQSGNRWSAPQSLAHSPSVDDLATIQAIDLLGNGTACLVWTSPLPGDVHSPMRYIDLMGGQKPHLLMRVANNVGAETLIEYVPSTKFHLADKRAGRPWITRLPFPVHVVERIQALDRVSGNRLVRRFAYHHGHYDGAEREFRGFGMVEQWDTEEFAALTADGTLAAATNIDAASHVPPVLTRTWFHTGAFVDWRRVSNYFAGMLDATDTGEYFREPGLDDAAAAKLLLDDTILPSGLTAIEEREGCRALKGLMLRQEVYALDGSANEPYPYVVSEQNFTIRLLQPRAENRHAVFLTHSRESIAYHYERNPADPRIAHTFTLDVDDFGNVRTAASVAYPRRAPDAALEARDQQKQAAIHVTCVQQAFTNAADTLDAYRAPLACESRSFEITGLSLGAGSTHFGFGEMSNAVAAAAVIPPEASPTPGVLEKRLLSHARVVFRADDLAGPLPLGTLQSKALPFENYQLAFTPGLLASVFGTRVTDAMLATEGGYVGQDGGWWVPSGQAFFSPLESDDVATELAAASEHFFLPRRFRDAFGNVATVSYDRFDLLVQETRDALGNLTTAGERDSSGALLASGNDYRVLRPTLLTDPNGNRVAVSCDALGMVVGTAVMGKHGETPRRGDLLDGFEPDLAEDVIAAHMSDPLADPHAILGRATSRLVYDLFAYYRSRDQARPSPNAIYTLARETHDADLAADELTKVQHVFVYSDGFGREIQKKFQAEPGPLIEGGPQVPERWVGSGWTIFNNKGAAVRQYEPFFTATPAFEFDVRTGVSPIVFYDALGRTVATLNPNHTWQKERLGPWVHESWDVNDTTLIADPAADPDIGNYFARLPASEYVPTWNAQRAGGALGPKEQDAAAKTALHAATPAVTHSDSLGRAFLVLAHNKFVRENAVLEEFYATRVEFDILGNQRQVVDAEDRVVVRYDYDMLGGRIHQASMEAGERWTLANVAGKPIYAWDSRDHEFRTTYDPLRRPLGTFLREGSAGAILIGHTEYGETQSAPEQHNLRGKVVRHFDQAGVVTTVGYDFKGNALSSSRQLAREYKGPLDWAANPGLEAESFTSSTQFDAFSRPVAMTAPDESLYQATYNEANLVEQITVKLRGASAATPFVANIDYDAKGQRVLVEYGNGVTTRYAYDPLTLLLRSLTTRRTSDQATLQDLRYTYDPTGNIASAEDSSQQTIYFDNQIVGPGNDYVYDAVYRLIGATGREHIGQVSQPQTSWNDEFRVHLPSPTDGQAMRRYTEEYRYDTVGNFVALIHRAAQGDWTRSYTYEESSQLEAGKVSNRLSRTQVGAGAPEAYSYDAHGNMTSMPHLASMQWDFRDQLCATSRQVVTDGQGETTYYVYDAMGQRVRKVTERQNGTRAQERLYLGGVEVFREYGADGIGLELERETLHVRDGHQRVALVETRTHGEESGVPQQLVRYQLKGVSLELDAGGRVISYEEYYPYGSTSYQAGANAAEVSRKRYRYLGMERDAESGASYHGARYYATWLGRWISCDPAGTAGGINLFAYAYDNPCVFADRSGNQPAKQTEEKPQGTVGFQFGVMVNDNGEERTEYGASGVYWTAPGATYPSAKLNEDTGLWEPLELEVSVYEKPKTSFVGRQVNRVTGAIGLVFNAGEAYLGGAVIAGSEGTAAVPGWLLVADASDKAAANVSQIWHGEIEHSMLYKGVKKLTGSDAAAFIADNAMPIVLGAAVKPPTKPMPPPRPIPAVAAPVVTTRLSDSALKARADELARDLGLVGAGARRGTVAVLQGVRDGKIVTLVTVNSAKYAKMAKDFLLPGEQLVEPILVNDVSRVTADRVLKSGVYVHAEQVLANESVNLTERVVATSNNACSGMCAPSFGAAGDLWPGIRHVNPAHAH